MLLVCGKVLISGHLKPAKLKECLVSVHLRVNWTFVSLRTFSVEGTEIQLEFSKKNKKDFIGLHT